MLYSLLGRMVWLGLKLFLRRKYGSTYAPKSLLAGGSVAIAIALALVFLKATRSQEQ